MIWNNCRVHTVVLLSSQTIHLCTFSFTLFFTSKETSKMTSLERNIEMEMSVNPICGYTITIRGNELLLTYHTPPKCMAKWLTSQNRNLVSVNIPFICGHHPLFTWFTSEYMRSVRDRRRKRAWTNNKPPYLIGFFSSECLYTCVLYRYKGVKSLLSE